MKRGERLKKDNRNEFRGETGGGGLEAHRRDRTARNKLNLEGNGSKGRKVKALATPKGP